MDSGSLSNNAVLVCAAVDAAHVSASQQGNTNTCLVAVEACTEIHFVCCGVLQVMLHTSAPFQAGELQAQQEELSKKLEAKKQEEARYGLKSVCR